MLSMLALATLAPKSTHYLVVDRLVIGSLKSGSWKSLETVPNKPGNIDFVKVGIGAVGGNRVAKGLMKAEPNMAGYVDVDDSQNMDGVFFSGPVKVPRKVSILDNSMDTYVAVVDKFLKSKGVTSTARITRLVKADLDGNGTLEVLIEASNRDGIEHSGMPGVQPGDYSLVLLRAERGTSVIEIPLAFDHPKADGMNYVNKIMAVADFDRNGSLDVVVTSDYYEGGSATLFGFNGSRARKLVEMGDGV